MLLRISLFLAIVAGLGGIYFANVPIKGRINTLTSEKEELEKGKRTAETQARTAKESVTSARNELEKVTAELAEKSTALDNQTRVATQQRARADAAAADATRYLGEKNQAQTELAKWNATQLNVTNVLDLSAKLRLAEKERGVFQSENQILSRQLGVLQEEITKSAPGVTRKRVELPAGITGSVMNVDPKFDFVILNIGSKQGLLKDGELIVARNGKYLAKIRVTDVQPDQSVADVIAAWKLADVMEGDQVLAER